MPDSLLIETMDVRNPSGEIISISKYGEMLHAAGQGLNSSYVPGFEWWELPNGRLLQEQADGTFKELQTGKVYRPSNQGNRIIRSGLSGC